MFITVFPLKDVLRMTGETPSKGLFESLCSFLVWQFYSDFKRNLANQQTAAFSGLVGVTPTNFDAVSNIYKITSFSTRRFSSHYRQNLKC